EQIVSDEYIKKNPHLTFLPALFVYYVVEAHYGAHPTACDNRYDYDLNHIEEYQNSTKNKEDFMRYVDKYIYGCNDQYSYLEKIGLENLDKIKRPEVIKYG